MQTTPVRPAAVSDGVSADVVRDLRQPTRPSAADDLVAQLVAEMDSAWWRGETPRAEDYIGAHPVLLADPLAGLRLVEQEVRLRRKAGLDVSSMELVRRFPDWADRIAELVAPATFVPPAAARARAASLPEVGETLGEYRLLAILGKGVRGAVFLAEQPSLANRPVVLKVTPREGREHLSLARLQHANIVPLYAVQDLPARELRLLCMPYLGGTTLSAILGMLGEVTTHRRTGRDILAALDQIQAEAPVALPMQGPARHLLGRSSYLQAVCWIGACLADALHFAHQRDLLHLDVKPSNILLAADGTPMLLDFHLAQAPLRRGETVAQRLGGTPSYMPAEQWKAMGEAADGRALSCGVDGRADIYALGVVLYEALGGSVPLGFFPMMARRFRRPPHVPWGLTDIIAKCLAEEPGERYADASQLADDLRRQFADLPLRGVRNRSVVERWRKWRRRRPQALARAATLAAAAAGLSLVVAAAGLDVRRRVAGAEGLLEQGRKHMEGREYPAAVRDFERGLTLLEVARGPLADRWLPRASGLRRSLGEQCESARHALLAQEFHELADRVRLLFGSDAPPSAELQGLERRLRAAWEHRDRVADRRGLAAVPELAERVRADALDLAILWADLRVRLAPAGQVAARRREALRILDEAEGWIGPSPLLEREREVQARALGLTELARSAARRFRELAPGESWGEHYALGRSYLGAGDSGAAALEFSRAVELRPEELWGHFYRGIVAYRLGRFDEAAHAFDICVALAPKSAACYYNRARARVALGRDAEALHDYDRALGLAPESGLTTLNRGVLRYRAGKFGEAIDDFRTAARLGADPVVVHYNLALAEAALGDRRAARAELDRVLRLAPHHPDALLMLETLALPPRRGG